MRSVRLALAALAGLLAHPVAAQDSRCLKCHAKVTPGIVADWRTSRHAAASIGCDTCHGTAHLTKDDAAMALHPSPATCAACHPTQVAQYEGGKHALAWAAMKAMPTFHRQPALLTDGLKGCGACHAIGLKTEADVRQIVKAAGRPMGVASCDACHTRHAFATKEARQPQACKTCHMGFDHAQWEMYDSSKHGVRNELKQLGVLPPETAAPTCQTCHMPGGDHGVMTAWGFLGVRLPLPEDPQWAADRVAILKALGVLDPAGKPTTLLEVVKGAKVARVTQEEWQALRGKMIAICGQCHAEGFARAQLDLGDRSIRDADRLMAEAIEIVAGLYRDGILARAKEQAFAYPNVLTFHDAPSVVEQRLFVMFLEHRMRTFQGSFHASPDYALWYGWSEMQRDLAEIRMLAKDMRLLRRLEGRPSSAPAGSPAAPGPRAPGPPAPKASAPTGPGAAPGAPRP